MVAFCIHIYGSLDSDFFFSPLPPLIIVCVQVQNLVALYESLQKELKGLSNEEGQLKRALAMKYDKQSKQQIRHQKKKELKEHRVQNILG